MANEIKGLYTLTYDYMGRECNCQKNTDIKKATTGVVLIVLAAASIIGALNGLVTNADFSSGLAVFGAIIFFVGVYLLLTCKSQWVYRPSGSVLSHTTYYYDPSAILALEKFIANGGSVTSLPKAKSLGSLMMDMYTTSDWDMVCVQLSQYKDFSYVPTSEPVMITDERTKSFCEYIKQYS